jgi:membrane protein
MNPLPPGRPRQAYSRWGLRRNLIELGHTLQHWPWFDTLRTLGQRFREDRLGLTASSLTFTTLIGLVPLVTVMLSLFSAFPVFARFQMALQQYFLQSLVPDNIARPVLLALTQFAGKANRLGIVGLVVVLVTALALVFTIDRTLNGIWRVPKPRPWAQRLLVYWAAITLGPLLMGASLAVTSYAVGASRGSVPDLTGGFSLLLALMEAVLLAAAFAGLFKYVPNAPVRWRHAWAGGAFVAVGIELAKRGLAWYVQSVPTYAVVYGAFATVPIFLLWIYLVWVIVLLGAVIAAYAPSLAMRVVRLPDRQGERFALALRLLQRLQAAKQAGQPGLSTVALATSMRLDPLELVPVLEQLQTLDWCALLDEPDDPRWVLLAQPADTLAAPLVDALLLQDRQASLAFRQHTRLDQLTLSQLLD